MLLSPCGEFFSLHYYPALPWGTTGNQKNFSMQGDVAANECICITDAGSLLPLKMHLHIAPYSAVCLMRGPQRLPRRVSHTLQSSAPSFDFQYPLFSLRSSGSCLRLLSRRPTTSIFPSIMCFRMQYLFKMWPSQLPFLLFLVYEGYSFRPWLYVIAISSFLTRSVQLISIFLQRHFYLRVIELKCVAFQYPFTQTSLISLAESVKFLTCIRKALYLTLEQDTIQKPRETYLAGFPSLLQINILIRCLKMITQFHSKYFAI